MEICAYCVEARKCDQPGFIGCAYIHRIPQTITPRQIQRVDSDEINMGIMYSVRPWDQSGQSALKYEFSVLFPFDSTCPCYRPINLLKYEDDIEEWIELEMVKEKQTW